MKVFLRHLHPFVRTLRVLEVSRKQHPPQKASCIFCVCFFFLCYILSLWNRSDFSVKGVGCAFGSKEQTLAPQRRLSIFSVRLSFFTFFFIASLLFLLLLTLGLGIS